LRGEIVPRPQDPVGATTTRRLRREDGRLDPSRPAVELERQVRAYQPWPGSFVETATGRIGVWAATVAAGTNRAPGTLDAEGLATVDGRLVPVEVQPAGGRRMSWAAFLRGHPEFAGSPALASEP
jgi:methionyl-tRNA formyltransferase